MKALQSVANRAQLTVCPPPYSWVERERERVGSGGGQNANKLC